MGRFKISGQHNNDAAPMTMQLSLTNQDLIQDDTNGKRNHNKVFVNNKWNLSGKEPEEEAWSGIQPMWAIAHGTSWERVEKHVKGKLKKLDQACDVTALMETIKENPKTNRYH